MQGIPLILETPSFERPRETWACEIGVLNGLSVMEGAEEGEILVRCEEMQIEIKDAVEKAEKASGKGSAKVKAETKATAKKNKKRARDEDDEDEEHVH